MQYCIAHVLIFKWLILYHHLMTPDEKKLSGSVLNKWSQEYNERPDTEWVFIGLLVRDSGGFILFSGQKKSPQQYHQNNLAFRNNNKKTSRLTRLLVLFFGQSQSLAFHMLPQVITVFQRCDFNRKYWSLLVVEKYFLNKNASIS